MATLPPLPFELYDSRHETSQIGNGVGERKWLVDWTDRYTFTGRPIKGRSLYTDGTEDQGMGTEGDRLICERIQYAGKGAGSVVGQYTIPYGVCEVTASYRERQPFGGSSLEVYRGDVRFLSVGADAVWDDGNSTPCEFPVTRAFPMGTLSVCLFFMHSNSLRANLDALTCKLNNATWIDTVGGGSFGAGTVRFDKYDCEELYDEVLGRIQKVTYYISIDPLGWNWFPGPGGQLYQRIPAVYGTASFNGLFTPATRIV